MYTLYSANEELHHNFMVVRNDAPQNPNGRDNHFVLEWTTSLNHYVNPELAFGLDLGRGLAAVRCRRGGMRWKEIRLWKLRAHNIFLTRTATDGYLT